MIKYNVQTEIEREKKYYYLSINVLFILPGIRVCSVFSHVQHLIKILFEYKSLVIYSTLNL